MEYITVFKNDFDPWTPQDDEELNRLYNAEMLDVMEISKIKDRSPGKIITRLCNNGYIRSRVSARGYTTYKNSDLYKQAILKRTEYTNYLQREKSTFENSTKTNNVDNILITINKDDYTQLNNNIKDMQNEIKDLKNIVKDLVAFIHVVHQIEIDSV